MKLKVLTLVVILIVIGYVGAQTQTSVATTAEEQKILKAFQDVEAKTLTALTTAAERLPEKKALDEAQKAYDAAVRKLPEKTAFDRANSDTWDEVYRIQAKHGLSSREYEPALNTSGALEFRKKARQ
jgi:predicted ribonuclease toxin of YeeF-YezG toxin-antitoxin module